MAWGRGALHPSLGTYRVRTRLLVSIPPFLIVTPAPHNRHSLRRQESIRRASATDGAQAPSPLTPTPHVIPAKAGTYPYTPPRMRNPTSQTQLQLALGKPPSLR